MGFSIQSRMEYDWIVSRAHTAAGILGIREPLCKVQLVGMQLAIFRDLTCNANPVGHEVLELKGLEWRRKP